MVIIIIILGWCKREREREKESDKKKRCAVKKKHSPRTNGAGTNRKRLSTQEMREEKNIAHKYSPPQKKQPTN